jgi:hypothetical protein
LTPEDELFSLIAAERRKVAEHPGWRSGPERIVGLLRMATWLRQMERANLGGELPPWESVLGLLIVWHHQFPSTSGTISQEHAVELVLAAAAFARLDGLDLSSRVKAYRVRKRGDRLVLSHRWNPALEVADAILERRTVPPELPKLTDAERAWIETNEARSQELPPFNVLQAAAARARRTITLLRDHQPEGALPESFSVGDGLTVGDTIDVLSGLMGFADLCMAAADALNQSDTVLVRLARSRLTDSLAELAPGCDETQIDTLVERLTYQPGRSPHNSPLVRHGEAILVCPPLIGLRLVDPIVLRSAGYEPGRFGPIGKSLGGLATKWAEWLSRIPGALVAERVKVVDPGGRTVGDLDVVAVDPAERVAVCFEIKWPIDAWSLNEVVKIEDWATKAAAQLSRVRSELTGRSAVAKLPTHWPNLSDLSWTWAIGIPRQLCLRPSSEPDVQITSLRYLMAMQPPKRLVDVAQALRHPDLPKEGEHFAIDRITVSLDRADIHVDVLAIRADMPWKPFRDRVDPR